MTDDSCGTRRAKSLKTRSTWYVGCRERGRTAGLSHENWDQENGGSSEGTSKHSIHKLSLARKLLFFCFFFFLDFCPHLNSKPFDAGGPADREI